MNVIVQAGGRGSRLRHHTWNKPKCLVSVRGKPLLYHLFDKFPDNDFIVIGDYAFDQLEKYLEVNPPGVNYKLIKTNKKGTISGIKEALSLVNDSDVLVTWSELINNDLGDIKSDHLLDALEVENVVKSGLGCFVGLPPLCQIDYVSQIEGYDPGVIEMLVDDLPHGALGSVEDLRHEEEQHKQH